MTALSPDVVADLRLENTRLLTELRAARDRQVASAEILQTIAGTSGDAERALQHIAETTARLFGASSVTLNIASGDEWARMIRVGASSQRVGAEVSAAQLRIGARNLPSTVFRENRQIHIPDLDNLDPAFADWPTLPHARAAGARAMAGTPLRREGKAVGALIVHRDRPVPFTDEELALLQSFADQAVIAIENARLFNETREALERQTATAEILKVIASSPSDVQPVFDVIVERAVQLCGARMGRVYRYDGNLIHLVGGHGLSAPGREGAQRPFPRPATDDTIVGRVMLSRRANILADLNEDETVPPLSRQMIEALGARSQVTMPMLLAGEPIGAITLSWAEPRGYKDQQITLLQTFADQAVIAIENVRLFNETREALERQTATADILKVIASSPSEVQPVFDAIATSAKRLIGGFSAAVFRFVDDVGHLAAFTPTRPAADEVWQASFPRRLSDFPPFEWVRGGEAAQVPDVETSPDVRDLARLRGFRSLLVTPLMSNGVVIGMVSVTRLEPGAFAAHHVQLLQTFADQAVIAIENVRLFDEVQARTEDLRESLQQQTATAEVLKVISRSTFDLRTVLETLVESAARLCEADNAFVYQRDGGVFRLAATYGFSADYEDFMKKQPVQPGRGTLIGRTTLEAGIVQIPDALADPEYNWPESQERGGYRTMLGIPMLREAVPIGVFAMTRSAVKPFTNKQIALLQTFSDQAVIAIQNVQLFEQVQAKTRDLTEALTYQTGSSNILRVIASSPTDVKPVLKAIVESACELCEAYDAVVLLKDGGDLRFSAHHGPIPINIEKWPISRNWTAGRAFVDRRPVHVPDMLSDEGSEFPDSRELSRHAGFPGIRSILSVPLLRENESIGTILLRRTEVQPFSDKQIALLQTFADQAVIAIGNVRLFDEVQAKTRELEESLEYQIATADVLNVISRSTTNVQPVFDAIAMSAARLFTPCETTLTTVHGGQLHWGATASLGRPVEAIERVRSIYPLPFDIENSPSARAIQERRIIEIADASAPATPNNTRRAQSAGEFRSITFVPLLRDGIGIGTIILTHPEAGFKLSPKQLALVQTFADQAVIAIENARLFDEVQAKTHELEEALTYQTGSSNILGVIASSPTDVKPVLKAIVESACELCEADDALATLKDGDDLVFQAQHGSIPVVWERTPINRQWASGRAVVDRKPVHVHDLLSTGGEQFPDSQEFARRTSVRTVLSVPLLRENESIGAIVLRRTVVQPFSDKQISLLQTFADQAVIAIGNVRLFEEVQARTRDLTESLQQQTATAEVLKVISASPGELQPVFQAMLENAGRLCEAKFAMLFLYEKNQFRAVGKWNLPPAYGEFLEKNTIVADPKVPLGRVAMTKQPVHVVDVLLDQSYIEGFPGMVGVAQGGGARTLLQVPMLKEKELVGTIGIYRQEVRPFTDKQIALVQNFAAQAVIAIENARLLNELRQRTDDLTASLDDLRTAQGRLIQTEKLASLGQLTAGIAHEIKNPLNFVNNFSALSAELTDELNNLLKSAKLSEKMREEVDELTRLLKDNLKKVVQHGKRADSIVKNMLLHSREGSGDHRPADINALLDESLNLAYHGARAEKPQFNVTLQRDFDERAGTIEVFPQEITRVFLNLISNGFYAVTKRKTENGGSGFDPVLRATTRNLGDAVEIRIRDNGTGIPSEVKEKMFNPFFTTKPAGEGTGLGLSMSHDIIVKQHGGTIDVATEPGQFTEFTIVLPRTSNLQEKKRGQP
jgi:GAF domain-containing protein